ncbi:MAG: GerMN domain-containing protein [Geobacteraceae bacterium]|nr:GerMN domain-containing protein [Geobacteraceae bacterium]
MKGRKSPRRGVWVIGLAFLILAMFLGALIFRKHERAATPPSIPAASQNAGLVTVTLFFASQSGDGLVREGREIDPCDELSVCFEEILEELINGPIGDLAPVLPLTGMFNSVRLDNVTARVDFAQELLDALPSGSNSELYAAYAVVNSICMNYPQVQQVVFTVDGKPLATLKGHLDTSSPITPDFSLEKGAAKPPAKKVKNEKK